MFDRAKEEELNLPALSAASPQPQCTPSPNGKSRTFRKRDFFEYDKTTQSELVRTNLQREFSRVI